MLARNPAVVGRPENWRYIRGSAQEFALSAPAHHLLLTGGRGWGKTEVQLVRFRRNVGRGYGRFLRGIIFDQEYKNLDDMITKSKKLFKIVGDGCRFLESTSALKWVWPTGEELLFRSASEASDYWAYHGHEYPFVGWNELTKYPDGKLYSKMLSVNRSGFSPEEHTPRHADGSYKTPDGRPLPPIPLIVCSTTNPHGPGHNWVKRQFIDAGAYGEIIRKSFQVFNPRTKQDEDIVRRQVAIFGSFRENPYLSPEYIAGLYEETDENIMKAWVHGDWDIVAGGALDDKWKRQVHVLPRFKVPPTWRVDRSFDWGSTHPFSVGWWAEANGEEATLKDGTKFCPPKGTLIQIAEWYGTKEIGTNVGVKLSAVDIANGIKEREIALMDDGWITAQPSPGPADNQISNVNEKDTETIEKKMADKGIRWTKADKSPGSRKQGLQLIRDRLEASTRREGAGLYFMGNCTASISTIPMLPRDEDKPDDIDTTAEDHPYDMTRYRVNAGNDRTAKIIRVSFAH